MAAIPPAITTQLAHADPNASPLTLNELIDVFNPLFSSVIDGSYIPYIIQAGTPGADKAGYAWIETDSAGRPLSTRIYYNGHWRRIYNGMIGEIRMYSGNPNDTAVWDANGHGVIGGIYDGWQICNGKNGAIDLSDHFIVGATMNNKDHSGYDAVAGNWQTFVDNKSSLRAGGSRDHRIVASDLPPLDSVNGLSTLMLHGKEAKESSSEHDPPEVLIDVHYGNATDHSSAIATYGSNPNGSPPVPQTDVPTLPPFIALGFITFQGYTT